VGFRAASMPGNVNTYCKNSSVNACRLLASAFVNGSSSCAASLPKMPNLVRPFFLRTTQRKSITLPCVRPSPLIVKGYRVSASSLIVVVEAL
jgi:hypothetical protein